MSLATESEVISFYQFNASIDWLLQKLKKITETMHDFCCSGQHLFYWTNEISLL